MPLAPKTSKNGLKMDCTACIHFYKKIWYNLFKRQLFKFVKCGKGVMDGLGLLYSEEEVSKAISESRRILKRYKALKLREKLENRSPKSPIISDMPRGGQKRPDSAYENFVNIISQTYQIEQCVERCEPQACMVLKQKYFYETELPQWKLAELAGYSISRYNDFLRQALLQFATAYRII